eukprot:GHVS01091298.1.p3 GENE.GHVS01091298.1~~GHVS01091298.1.p3  ORF type:complete len:118 (-),score=12.90 GHVS01091298.1:120-473(-)
MYQVENAEFTFSGVGDEDEIQRSEMPVYDTMTGTKERIVSNYTATLFGLPPANQIVQVLTDKLLSLMRHVSIVKAHQSWLALAVHHQHALQHNGNCPSACTPLEVGATVVKGLECSA